VLLSAVFSGFRPGQHALAPCFTDPYDGVGASQLETEVHVKGRDAWTVSGFLLTFFAQASLFGRAETDWKAQVVYCLPGSVEFLAQMRKLLRTTEINDRSEARSA
jgi:hypothetical protein